MNRPLIAVTCSSKYDLPWGLYAPPQRLDYLVEGYVRCVELAGGLPVGLPLADDPDTAAAIVARTDGLILSGGPDIAPHRFNQEPKPGLGEVDHRMDETELAAARAAVELGKPVLGVCRGIQLLAAALGGDLYQDIPTEVPGALNHSQQADKAGLAHKVALQPGTRLHAIVGQDSLWVNSKHHQAVKTPPPGFVVSARSSDGLIEALERPEGPFLMAVQWHPEGTCHRDRSSLKIFQALIEAAG